jgi:integrase/recombinase XerD
MTFENYILDRKYLRNVSPKTLLWYKDIQRAFPALNIESPQTFRESAMQAVRGHLERGVKPVSVNSWLTGVRAYGIWLWQEGHLKEKPRIELLKYEQKILITLSKESLHHIINFRPKGQTLTRSHLATLTILDCGLRASELLGLTVEHVDMDNLVIKVVNGKGGKHRLVPFSAELRKHLFRYAYGNGTGKRVYIFGTKNDTKVSARNLERDFKALGERLSIPHLAPHQCRHTFACEYLKRGGNLEFLRRILGHTSLVTTQKYLKSLGVPDLCAVHQGLTSLSASGR